MKLGLDSKTFKWFKHGLELEEKYPCQKPRGFYASLYPVLVDVVLKREEKTDLEKLAALKELHEEYQRIMVALDQFERGELHETTPIDATGQTHSEATGGYGQDAAVAL